MTKNVWVSVCGVHVTEEEQEPVRTFLPGVYYKRNGNHYILYEEPLDGTGEKVKNRIKVLENAKRAEVVKTGAGRTEMHFAPEEKHFFDYQTPFGMLRAAAQTKKLRVEEAENRFGVYLEYTLEAEGTRISDCALTVEVTPREA